MWHDTMSRRSIVQLEMEKSMRGEGEGKWVTTGAVPSLYRIYTGGVCVSFVLCHYCTSQLHHTTTSLANVHHAVFQSSNHSFSNKWVFAEGIFI